MAKKKSEEFETEALELPEDTIILPSTAYGVAKDAQGNYRLITIEYNAVTGDVGPVVLSKETDIKGVVIERFKIEVANNLFSND